ncbi:MAG TPA: hypothetical protein VFO28_10415, partial [Burkholderiaceae bacterium]|nr:hypothetical protein [Burkholderiaceae bacterium]
MSVLLCWPLVGGAALAHDFSGDLPAVRAFLDRDKSYAAADRAEAEAAFTRLKSGAADMSPAAFHLAVAQI